MLVRPVDVLLQAENLHQIRRVMPSGQNQRKSRLPTISNPPPRRQQFVKLIPLLWYGTHTIVHSCECKDIVSRWLGFCHAAVKGENADKGNHVLSNLGMAVRVNEMIDDTRLLSHARSRDLKSDDNLDILAIQPPCEAIKKAWRA